MHTKSSKKNVALLKEPTYKYKQKIVTCYLLHYCWIVRFLDLF